MAIKVWGAGSTQGSDKNWNTASNWDNDTLPVDGDSILFDGTAVNYLQYGPSSYIYIENVELTSACELNVNGCIMDYTSEPLLIFGSLINNSFINYSNPVFATKATIYMWAWGITSVVGAWSGYLKPVTGVTPDTEIYFNGNQVFNTLNHIDLIYTYTGFTVAIRKGTGSSGTSVTNIGAFSQITFEDIFLDMSGVYKIDALSIILKNTSFYTFPQYFYNGIGEFEITCNQLTIQSSSSMTGSFFDGLITPFNYNNGGSPAITKLALKNPCTINVNGNWQGIGFNRNLIMVLYGNCYINLYNDSIFYGTNESTSAGMPGQYNNSYATLLSSYGTPNSVVIDAHNNSKILGVYSSQNFLDAGSSSPYGPGILFLGLAPSTIVNMRDDSIFIGSISSISPFYGNSSVSFFDSSNINFGYVTNPSTNPASQPGEFYPIVGLNNTIAEAIPQTQTGLTIFKSSF